MGVIRTIKKNIKLIRLMKRLGKQRKRDLSIEDHLKAAVDKVATGKKSDAEIAEEELYDLVTNDPDLSQIMSKYGAKRGAVIRYIGLIDIESGFVRSKWPSVTDVIKAWAKQHDFKAIVWTDLPSNFVEKKNRPFTVANAIIHLRELSICSIKKAQEYVRKAPSEIDTPLRRALAHDSWWCSLE